MLMIYVKLILSNKLIFGLHFCQNIINTFYETVPLVENNSLLNRKNAFSPNGTWTENFETSTLMSVGANGSYHSFLGPINFDLSWVNKINKVRVFFSVGLTLK